MIWLTVCLCEIFYAMQYDWCDKFLLYALPAGLEWHTEDFLHVTGCLGSTATLGWAYVPQPGEIVETIFWTKQRDSEQATIASYYQ